MAVLAADGGPLKENNTFIMLPWILQELVNFATWAEHGLLPKKIHLWHWACIFLADKTVFPPLTARMPAWRRQ